MKQFKDLPPFQYEMITEFNQRTGLAPHFRGHQVANIQHPVSHKIDPDTSKAAERSIIDSGRRRTNNQTVAWLVARYPKCTASELAFHAGNLFAPFKEMSEDACLIEIRRRLSDMNGIHVRRGEKHEARIGLLKNKESIWFPK